jgi:hypothetical protein
MLTYEYLCIAVPASRNILEVAVVAPGMALDADLDTLDVRF